MKRSIKLLALFALTLSSAQALADHEMAYKPSPAMKKLQSLAGTWNGKTTEQGQEVNMEVKYKITSGGTAVVETLFPGTAKEMVSVYYQDGEDLMMTHYCTLGNQPTMKLVSSKGGKLKFEEVRVSGLKTPEDPYMGAVTLTMKGDKLDHAWSMIMKGETKGVHEMSFQREK